MKFFLEFLRKPAARGYYLGKVKQVKMDLVDLLLHDTRNVG